MHRRHQQPSARCSTISIGVILVITGVLMLFDGGAVIQTIINVICGGMFFSAGTRNGAEYFRSRA